MMNSPHQQLDLVTSAAIKGNLDAVKRLVAMRTTKLDIPGGLLALLLCDHPITFEGERNQNNHNFEGLTKKARGVSQTHYNRIAFYLMKNCDFDILSLDAFLGDLIKQPENTSRYYRGRLTEKKHPMIGQDVGMTLDTVLGLELARDDEDFLDLPQFQVSMRMSMLKNEIQEAIVANDLDRFNHILASALSGHDQYKALSSMLPDSLIHSLCSTLRAFNYESKADQLMPALSSKQVLALLNGLLVDFNAMRVLDDTKNIARMDNKFIVRIMEISELADAESKARIQKTVESIHPMHFAQFCQENNAMNLGASQPVKNSIEVSRPNGCCCPGACPPCMELQKEQEKQEAQNEETNQNSGILTMVYQRFIQSLDLDELSQTMQSFAQEDGLTKVHSKP